MSLGSLAGAGTLGILIPPSIMMVIYAVQANVSIIQVFLAGFLPGFLVMALYSGYIVIWSLLNPDKQPPPEPPMTFREKVRESAQLIPTMLLILLVFARAAVRLGDRDRMRRLGRDGLARHRLVARHAELGVVLAERDGRDARHLHDHADPGRRVLHVDLDGLHRRAAGAGRAGSATSGSSPYALIAALTVMYIVLGTALDGISMIVLTTAVVIPMIKAAGFDLVWFGIFVVLVVEMAEVSPPVGFNLFVLQTMSGKDSNFVARASLPFFFLLVLAVAIITVFPEYRDGAAADGVSNVRGAMTMMNRVKFLAAFAGVLALTADRFRADQVEPAERLSERQSARRESQRLRQGRVRRDRRQAADHGPRRRLAVQGTGDQARGRDRAGAGRRDADLDPGERETRSTASTWCRSWRRASREAMKLWKASRPAIEKKLAAQGIMVLFGVPWGPQGIYAKKELNTIEDMKGLKWRAYNVGTARIGEMVGAQAVTVQAAELPQALATGVVNSFMSSGATGYDSKVWETLTYFYDTRAWIPKNVTFVNKAAFDALDKPTQEAVLKAAKVAEERGWKVWESKTEWYHEEIAKKGMKVLKPSKALEDGFKKIGEQLTADWLKKAGADGQAVVDAYKKM